ncbi:hypothetical protein BDV93DRAFT_516841 [Ceratobasidium sp. AG-I]|nr:hypothetical protein BDV93DRAFT_516841 [Ceratobasidium sp. AG-I]
MALFEYPQTRPYRGRYTTVFILAVCVVVIAVFTYVNVNLVGFTLTSAYSPNFTPERTLSWQAKWRASSNIGANMGCEPASLVAGGTFRTSVHHLYPKFSYPANSFYDSNTQRTFSTANYAGEVLTNCSVDSMEVSAYFFTSDTVFLATFSCVIGNNISVTATVSTTVGFQLFNVTTQSSIRLGNSILKPFGFDYFYKVVHISDQPSARPWDMKLGYNLGPGPQLAPAYGMVTDANALTYGDTYYFARQNVTSPETTPATENFIRIFWSSILSDLGTSSNSNMFTDLAVLNSSIKSLRNFGNPRFPEPAYRGVLSQPENWSLPLALEPVPIQSRYLCHFMSWKPTQTLVIDVMVATLTFFTLFWGCFKICLEYFFSQKEAGSE